MHTSPNMPIKLGVPLQVSAHLSSPLLHLSLLCLLGLMLWHLSHDIMKIYLLICLSPTLCELPEDKDCIHGTHTIIGTWLAIKVDGE